MAWFKKKPDPISDRARALNDEIAQLEAEIKRLDSRAQQDQSQPRLRPAAVPHGTDVPHALPAPGQAPAVHEPIFEEVQQHWLKGREETATTPDHYNDLGVRKYDLPAFLRRVRFAVELDPPVSRALHHVDQVIVLVSAGIELLALPDRAPINGEVLRAA